MSADQVFSLASGLAVMGWLVLAFGAFLRREFLVTTLAGRIWPLGLAALYTALIIFFFPSTPGGFDSLPHVQLLFTSPWAATAGWVHYLAFDLFVGAWITAEVLRLGIVRLALIVLLPLTFLFGPIGLLAFFIAKAASVNKEVLA
jgi:hypothetical protein